MDDLIEFLKARLDEDQQEALAAAPGPWRANAEQDEVLAVDGETVADGFALSGQQLRATVRHIALHNPARALREVEAKRRILNGCEEAIDEFEQQRTGGKMNTRWVRLNAEHLLRLLALPYADHEGYHEDWRP